MQILYRKLINSYTKSPRKKERIKRYARMLGFKSLQITVEPLQSNPLFSELFEFLTIPTSFKPVILALLSSKPSVILPNCYPPKEGQIIGVQLYLYF